MSRPPDSYRGVVDSPDGLFNRREPPGHAYRLEELLHLKKHLEDHRDKQTLLTIKYHRKSAMIDTIGTGLITVSMAMSVTGVGLLTTIVAAPAVIALECVAAACGALGVAGGAVKRRLVIKTKKHSKIRDLVLSQLNVLTGLMSTALNDGVVTDDEFHRITREIDILNHKIEDVRAGAEKAYDEVTLHCNNSV